MDVIITPNPAAGFNPPPPPPPPAPQGAPKEQPWAPPPTGAPPGFTSGVAVFPPTPTTIIYTAPQGGGPPLVAAAAAHVAGISIGAAVLHFMAMVLALVAIFIPWYVVTFLDGSSFSYGLTSYTACFTAGSCTVLSYNDPFRGQALNPGSLFLTIANVAVACLSIATVLFLLAFISSTVAAVAQCKASRAPAEAPATCGCMGTAFTGTGLAASAYVFAWLGSFVGLYLFGFGIPTVIGYNVTSPGRNAGSCVKGLHVLAPPPPPFPLASSPLQPLISRAPPPPPPLTTTRCWPAR